MSEKNAQPIKTIGRKFKIQIFKSRKESKFRFLIFFKKIQKIKIISYLDSSHFSDNNGYIICRISINGFKDIDYAILHEYNIIITTLFLLRFNIIISFSYLEILAIVWNSKN